MTSFDKITYKNGNYEVSLFSDGSKIREWKDEVEPCADFPESIDLKITDWCDARCFFCHEKSTTKGIHAKKAHIISVLNGLPSGVEIAIGGGDPCSHPEIESIIMDISSRKLIPNMTINSAHLERRTKGLNNLHL